MKTVIVIPRNMSGLRDTLFWELENIVNMRSNPGQTAQVSKIASHILTSVREETNRIRFTPKEEMNIKLVEIL